MNGRPFVGSEGWCVGTGARTGAIDGRAVLHAIHEATYLVAGINLQLLREARSVSLERCDRRRNVTRLGESLDQLAIRDLLERRYFDGASGPCDSVRYRTRSLRCPGKGECTVSRGRLMSLPLMVDPALELWSGRDMKPGEKRSRIQVEGRSMIAASGKLAEFARVAPERSALDSNLFVTARQYDVRSERRA